LRWKAARQGLKISFSDSNLAGDGEVMVLRHDLALL
jgi:hypothetical protein